MIGANREGVILDEQTDWLPRFDWQQAVCVSIVNEAK